MVLIWKAKSQLEAPRYKNLNFSVVVYYYSRVEPRHNEPLYDEFLDVTNPYGKIYGKESR